MLRITILILCSILISSAKVLELQQELDNDVNETTYPEVSFSSFDSDPLWVLKLDGKWDMVLKAASPHEEDEFEEYDGPLIEKYERIQYAKYGARKPFPRLPVPMSDKIVDKEDIFRLLNKFLLTTNKEPDAYLSESHEDDPFIALYFKGPYASLVLEADNRQWRFFIPSSASPWKLPAWFYTNRVRSSEGLVIPEGVK